MMLVAWLLFLLTVALTTSAQALQKVAAREWRAGSGLLALVRLREFQAAILCLALALICWLGVLQRWEVGRAYALLGVNYVVMLLIARRLFHEAVSVRHWLGISLVVAGAALLGVDA
jgi:undecaprenyl phosphate-alpha-L-ara4N flippase subunit ArnE